MPSLSGRLPSREDSHWQPTGDHHYAAESSRNARRRRSPSPPDYHRYPHDRYAYDEYRESSLRGYGELKAPREPRWRRSEHHERRDSSSPPSVYDGRERHDRMHSGYANDKSRSKSHKFAEHDDWRDSRRDSHDRRERERRDDRVHYSSRRDHDKARSRRSDIEDHSGTRSKKNELSWSDDDDKEEGHARHPDSRPRESRNLKVSSSHSARDSSSHTNDKDSRHSNGHRKIDSATKKQHEEKKSGSASLQNGSKDAELEALLQGAKASTATSKLRRQMTPSEDDAFERLTAKKKESTKSSFTSDIQRKSNEERTGDLSAGATSRKHGKVESQQGVEPATQALVVPLNPLVVESQRVERPTNGSKVPAALLPALQTLSFQKVMMPHELLEPANESRLPSRLDGKKLRAYRVIVDPKLDKTGKAKEVVTSTEAGGQGRDPRKKGSRRATRKDFRLLVWKWDLNSTKSKPPPPPCAVTVSQLSPLMTMAQLKMHFRSFGNIEEAKLEMDPITGASLGVFYIRFRQDYDEELRLKPNVLESASQRGDLIAREIVREVDGQQLTGAVVKVILDDNEKTNYVKICREEMSRKHPPKSKDVPTAPHSEAAAATFSTTLPSSAVNSPGPMQPPLNASRASNFNGKLHAYAPPHHQRFGRGGHLDKSASPYSMHSLIGTPHYGYSSPGVSAGPRAAQSTLHSSQIVEDTEDNVETIKETIAKKPHFFVKRTSGRFNRAMVYSFFNRCAGVQQSLADKQGWYIFFDQAAQAELCKGNIIRRLHDEAGLMCHLVLPGGSADLQQGRAKSFTSTATRRDASLLDEQKLQTTHRRPSKTVWSEEDLAADSMLLIKRDLGGAFMQEVKKRILKPFLENFMKPDSTGGRAIHSGGKKISRNVREEEESEEESEREDVAAPKGVAATNKIKIMDLDDPLVSEIKAEHDDVDQDSIRRRSLAETKRAAKKTTERARHVGEVDALAADDSILEPKKTTTKAQKMGKKMRERSPPVDPFAAGLAEEEEDLYYLRVLLEKMRDGMTIGQVQGEAEEAYEAAEAESATTGPLELPRHPTGSARTEGHYRIKPADKSLHMPDRNQPMVSTSSAVGLASARDNRADSRRFVQGIEQHKKETATDTDILKFNQLRSRKKQLKFDKSPIHDWGLYAMELIPAGDMVIEYVGEIVRQQVADQREKMYERQGNFSTYLFRVDDDVVVDATKKGNIARLMNHCCTPNCNAKILTLNGEKRIVLFAKNTIFPGQELTYDYKFQATGDEEDAIACLCGSPGCRRFL